MSGIYEKSCRICLVEAGQISVHEKRHETKTIADLIMEIANVTITFNDDYPQSVCSKCANRIEIAFDLKIECENSDIKLHEFLQHRKLVEDSEQDPDNFQENVYVGNYSLEYNDDGSLVKPKLERGDHSLRIVDDGRIPVEDGQTSVKMETVTDETNEYNIALNNSSECSNSSEGHKNISLKNDDDKTDLCCEYCDRVFRNLASLSNHMRKHKATPHVCDVCGKEFKLRQNLINHMRTHTGEKPFECDICSKKFSTRSNVFNHRRTHSTDKPYVCDVCGKQFPTISHLRNHGLSHVPIEERKYKCDKCNKTFRDRKIYMRHLNLHNGIRNEMCELCGKKFCNKNDVTRHHKTVHLGIKKYVCSVCSKAFSNSSNLESHFRIHTGEKPFHCKYCDMKFNQSTPLVKHTKIHLERGDPMRPQVQSPTEEDGVAIKTENPPTTFIVPSLPLDQQQEQQILLEKESTGEATVILYKDYDDY